MNGVRTLAVSRRILRQLARDPRTVALILLAPVAILWLLKLLFAAGDYSPRLAAINIPEPLRVELRNGGARLSEPSLEEAEAALARNDIDAILRRDGGKMIVKVEGSDPTATRATLRVFQAAVTQLTKGIGPPAPKVEALHGSPDLSLFDNFGPVLLGFFVFMFTFFVSGMSFVRERSSGTLERMLATPLRRHEVVLGYMMGFAVVALVQATVIALVAVTLLHMMLAGRFIWLLAIVLLLALTALSLGMLLSAFARSEFQMFQLVPLVVVPQIFFSGLLPLDNLAMPLRAIGNLLPLTYGAHALREVMIRGGELADIWTDLAALAGFVVVCVGLNVAALRKYRRL